ncbi:PAS domain S-box [Rivularia sp. PCC 7116]|nr:PAS domain S-box [Rivularia sp. PCC 7116]
MFVVGIGASAGGLQAIEEFFQNMPNDSGAAFVIVQHLSPNFKSLMKEILQRHTRMEIYRVTDGMELAPNSIYLIPADKNLILEDGSLHLVKREDQKHVKPNFPIDLFFKSLAQNYGEHAIGVVLSGTGSDGSIGLQAINEAKGIVLVQEPSTAEFDGMPLSAIAILNLQHLPQRNLNGINQVASPAELAELIHTYLISPVSIKQEYINSYLGLDDKKLSQITDILSQYQQVDFSFYKRSTLSRRIHRRSSAQYCNKIEEYITILQKSDKEKQALFQDLSITVTSFFRDKGAWEYLSQKVIPDLIEKTQPDEELRFWVSACATGEEAYSLAIVVDEALEKSQKQLRVKIFTTDINEEALEKAAIGIYSKDIVGSISPQRLEKYFIPRQDSYQVKRKLRDMLIFAAHDLTKDVGFTRINLVTCRNMLIYLQSELQRRVLQNIHFSLKNKGILFLGDSEHLGDLEDEFVPIIRKHKIYYKRRDVTLNMPIFSVEKPDKYTKYPSSNISYKNKPTKREFMLEKVLKAFLNDKKATCLIVDKNNQVVEIFEDLAGVLRIPIGKLSSDITQLVLPSLKLPLNTALYRIRKEKESVVYKGIKLAEENNVRTIQLKVDLYEDSKVADDLLMVNFQEQDTSVNFTPEEDFQPDSQASERINHLEYQLKQAEESFQTLVEELESIDEEHQAANEELTASNEELQSTNEELHSVNQELYTVNSEYQLKIHELIELNEDMNNLLRSTNIGVVFLDKQLRIRKFTPAATIAVNLIETDINRPLRHLSHNLDCVNFIEIIQEATQNEESFDLEVKLADFDRYLLMRINPYIKDNGTLDGIVLTFIDINEIKTAQNQLQETLNTLQYVNNKLNQKQAEFEAIFSSLPDALIFTDKARNIRMLNPGFTNLFGYQAEELIGKSPESLYANLEDYHDHKIYIDTETIDSQTTSDQITPDSQTTSDKITPLEINFRRSNQDVFVSETFKTPVRDKQGNIFGFLKLIRDISYRKQAEADLRDSEERFRSLYLRTPVMLHSIDKDGRILDVSNYWLDKLGYQREEVIGKRFIQFLTLESRNEARGILPEFFRNGSCWDINYQFLPKNGEVIETLLSAVADKNEAGEIIRTLAVMIDITERKKAEAALRESEARFKNMADSAPVLIWMSDAKGKAIFLNKAWLELTGISLEQQLGDAWLESIHEEDLQQDSWYKNLSNLNKQSQPIEIQFRIRGSDGQYYWMLGKEVPRFSQQGEIIGYIGSCIDITEIRNAKEQLYRANYQLEKNTIQLSRAKEAAETTNQAKSSFIAHMSHELRTPLNGILGFAQILQADDTLNREQQNKIDIIHQSGEHLLTLLNDILNLSKIEAEQLELELKDISFPLFLEKIISIINVRAQQKNITFNYRPSSRLPAVIRADETRLRQVLLNLLGNAVKFTHDGEVNFYVSKLENNEVKDNSGCLIQFKIEDTGIGIPQNKTKEIFLPFHQLKNDDSLNEGSGLGLSISQKIVNLMGGKIQVESTTQKGSTFYFDLHFSEIEDIQHFKDFNLELHPIGIKGKQPKILVVDDNKINRAVVVSYLQQLGFEISEANNGKQALETVKNLKPDLVLLDLVMPIMDGFETTKALKSNPQFKDLPIIAISANAMFDAQLSSYRIGCNAFLSKPVDLKILIKSIAQFIDIEWVYPELPKSLLLTDKNQPQQITSSQDVGENEALIPPPKEQVKGLIHLTQIGDIEAIIQKVEYLENLDTKYLPFIKKVCELAQSFQQHKLQKFLEDFLK